MIIKSEQKRLIVILSKIVFEKGISYNVVEM